MSFHWEIDKNYVLAVKEGKLIIKVTVAILTALSCLHIIPCKGIQDSLRFWIPCSGFRIPGNRFRISLPVELGFWTPIVSGIAVSWAGLQIPQAKISQIRESGLSYMGQYKIYRAHSGNSCSFENFLSQHLRS